MSSDETQSPLARAYDLVEAGDLEEARALLESILDGDSENADAWWIYAHAVTDPEAGRKALENVLNIDPNYPGAAELFAQAEELSPPKPKITPLAPDTMPEPPGILPEDEIAPPKTAAPKATQRKTPPPPPPQRRSPFPVLAVVAIIVIALVLLVLLLQNTGAPLATATPTTVAEAIVTSTEAGAVLATEEPTEAIPPTEAAPTEVIPTEVPPTAVEAMTSEAASIDYAAIEAAMSEFSLAESGVGVVDTSFGSTLVVSVCTTQGRAMRTLLPQVMNALAKQSPALGSDISAIGTRMLDCTENATLITVATDLASAQSYAGGGLTDGEFAAAWKPE